MDTHNDETLLVTSCTHCQSSFNITHEELDVADGQVRCSSCHEVFDAYFHLNQIESSSDELPLDENFDESNDKNEMEIDADEFSELVDSQNFNSEEIEAEHIEPDVLTPEIINPDILEDDFSQPELNYNEIDDTEILEEHSTIERLIETDSIDPDLDSDRAEPNLFETEISETILKESEISLPDFSEADPTLLIVPNDSTDAIKQSEVESEVSNDAQPIIKDSLVSESKPIDKESSPSIKDSEESFETITFNTDEFEIQPVDTEAVSLKDAMKEGSKNTSSFGSKLFWILGIIVLIVVFIVQWIYFQRFTLIQYPSYQPIVLNICSFIPCDHHKFRDLKQIELLERNIYSHPEKDNALLITGSFINKAPFKQAAPQLNVELFNVQGEVIAQRIFNFSEYRQVLISQNLIDTDATMIFKIEIEDPNIETITYEINFL